MTRERLSEIGWHALSFSLPPCGGGSGRGVAPQRYFPCGTPLPAPLRVADLSHKGRGDKKERLS